jgi:hypothetical protein
MLVLNKIEILPPLEKYKYDTWRILLVKCRRVTDNSPLIPKVYIEIYLDMTSGNSHPTSQQ